MMIWLIVAFALAALGVLLFIVLQMPDAVQKKRKKKNEPPPEPVKDWKTIAERVEKRLHATEQTLSGTLDELKGRDKKIAELNKSAGEMKKQFDQEKVWREKGEALVAKEKKQERLLQEELEKTRTDLNTESTQRIKQEYELKELRLAREELTSQVRKLSAQGMQLERAIIDALTENKKFKEENFELKKKKEGEEWIAKSDYRRLEGVLKRSRWEVEQFKKKISVAEWPKALQPKRTASPEASTPAQKSSVGESSRSAVEQDPSSKNTSRTPEIENNSPAQGA
ncbi:MAG: hypothetical protein HQL21_00740 [Candidatus Omnitrophica bacterium]|nr:hypothetical protein [Candidatus Omnitrophota bacterium]